MKVNKMATVSHFPKAGFPAATTAKPHRDYSYTQVAHKMLKTLSTKNADENSG